MVKFSPSAWCPCASGHNSQERVGGDKIAYGLVFDYYVEFFQRIHQFRLSAGRMCLNFKFIIDLRLVERVMITTVRLSGGTPQQRNMQVSKRYVDRNDV